MAALYDFLFESAPSPNTIKRIRETVERGRTRIIRDHGQKTVYWSVYATAQNDLIEALKDLEKELDGTKEPPAN